jgi:hypothetical protein
MDVRAKIIMQTCLIRLHVYGSVFKIAMYPRLMAMQLKDFPGSHSFAQIIRKVSQHLMDLNIHFNMSMEDPAAFFLRRFGGGICKSGNRFLCKVFNLCMIVPK